MTIQISDLDATLRKVIQPAIVEELPSEVPFYDLIGKDAGLLKKDLKNNTFYITARTGRHSGIVSAAEGATLHRGSPDYSQMSLSAKYTFGSFDISDQAIEATKNDEGALANALTEQGRVLRVDFGKEFNRIFMRDGNGYLCKTNGSSAGSTTVTVQDVHTISGSSDIPGTEYLAKGQSIIIDGGSAVSISSIDSETQITIASSRAWSDGGYITKADGDGTAADEPIGMDGLLVTSGTVQGLALASNSWMVSNVETSSAVTSESLINQYSIKANKYAPKKEPLIILMNQSTYRKYAELLVAYRQIVSQEPKLIGGWSGLAFNAAPVTGYIVLDYDIPNGYILGIRPSTFSQYEMTPLSWIDRGDGILRRIDTVNWQGVMRWYGNFGCNNFRANFKLTNKTYS